MIAKTMNPRAAYAGELLLTSERTESMDSWATGLNNNVLVLGCSGAGKTRNFLKPNLLQCHGSYVVLDSKGRLFHEMAPYLSNHGYTVDCLDFTTMEGTVGYDPLHHVRWRRGRPLAQDIIGIASALFPRDEMGDDPFWASAAANYVASYIAYVFEALPDREWNMASVVSVFEQACEGNIEQLFCDLRRQDPESYAVSLFRRARSTARAEKMHSSIMGIIAANLMPLTFDGALASFRKPEQIDFRDLGRERRVLFVTMDDMDRSLAPLTSLFIRQAFSSLCDFADASCEGGRLPVPVRFMLDDFANLTLPGFDDVLSVIRSREISCIAICQTVSQLEARYGEAQANSIIGNCDRHLVLGFQDERTARYFALRANKTPSTLLETPSGRWWLFERGQRGVCEPAYELERRGCLKEGETMDKTMNKINERLSLSERIARASAIRDQAATVRPERELIDAERRSAFGPCYIYRAHADELLQIVGQISDALPSRASFLARTDPTEAARPENHSVAAYAEVENPAVAFVWELRHNPEGALATLPDRSYSKVLDATDVLKELWEDKPAVNELELAKALITQIVLLDDNLCEQVLTRANIMARECSTAVAPYLRPQS